MAEIKEQKEKGEKMKLPRLKMPKLFKHHNDCEDADMDDVEYVNVPYGNRIYQIPVDPDGYVPKWAIVSRFQQCGDTSDIDETDMEIINSECTPQEIIRWWADPSSCDVEGIDTEDSDVYRMDGVPSSHIHAQRKIGVLAEPEEQERIRRELSKSFTREELETMASKGSFIIRSIGDCGEATGCYYRRQDGVEIPIIVIEKGCTADGIVHETVHHIRAVDNTRSGVLRTTYPTANDGKLNARLFSRLPKKEKDRILADEERATVMETVARTKTDPVQSGYYDGCNGDPRSAYIHDRRVLTNTPAYIPEQEIPQLKGKQARDAVTKNYGLTEIARARILKEDD